MFSQLINTRFLAMAALLPSLVMGTPAFARDSPAKDLPLVLAADLPKEARDTLALIKKGGPFPYPKDGVVFGNREKILPRQPRGFYHEYTVKTPGARNRGTQRIVCGDSKPSVCYFTGDHYQTFRQIKE